MKILIIGGSYFLGRAFTMVASKEHELTLLNRGNIPMERYNVSQYKADRRDIERLQKFPNQDYDVVVDFCAYNPGDIRSFVENMPIFPGLIKKYIFVSTVDVYERNVGYVKDENTPLSTTRYGGDIGDYIYGKICLEKELKEVCNRIGINYVIIRPSIIYGPNNYAPRESKFIKMASNGIPIRYPKDAKAKFQMVYVKDVAEAILKACKRTQSEEYNICSNEAIGYEEFMKVLSKVSEMPLKLEPISTEEALNQAAEGKVHLPFPVTEEENEIYDGSKAQQELGIEYTSLLEGIKKAYECFK